MSTRPILLPDTLPTVALTPETVHAQLRAAHDKGSLMRDQDGVVHALKARHMDILLDPSRTRQLELEMLAMQDVQAGPIHEITRNLVLWSNGGEHRRRRGALTRTFAFKLMQDMRPHVRTMAEALIRERLAAGPIDFLNDVAGQIPARIIAEILGLPEADIPEFQSMVDVTGKVTFVFPSEERAHIEQRLLDFFAYADALIQQRRDHPRDDFLSKFVNQTGREEALTDEELRANLIGLIIAGSDTTRNSITMAFSLLLDHPEQWRMVVADPEGMKRPAALEGQRFEPIAYCIPRIVTTAFELDGFAMQPGEMVLFNILSACRDPDVFTDPDRFDIMRTDHPRMALGFGGGAHRCLGEALAWVQIEETIAALARLAPASVRHGPPARLGLEGSRLADRLVVSLEGPGTD